jgi:exosortase C (VPDSG-CTERM-specific)
LYSLVLFFTGICCWFLSGPAVRALAFPLGFLVFLAPLPVAVESAVEFFLQHGSSLVAQIFFQVIGTPVFRDDTIFHLPGFSLQVAPECSGIHSTLALFITSLVAGRVLLRSTRNRTILTLAVLPIALLRNGLRIATIGELCVRYGPEMIDSSIHRQGGPIFFAISLVPFSLLLLFLFRADRPGRAPLPPAS